MAAYDAFFQPNPVWIDVGDGTTDARSGAVKDVNGDGKDDVVIAANASNGNGIVYIFEQHGSSLSTTADSKYGTTGNTAISLDAGDVNGDGLNDIVVSNFGSSSISILLQTSSNTFSTPTVLPLAGGAANYAYSVKIGDLNNDGRADIGAVETSAFKGSTITAFIQNSTGGFAPQLYPLNTSLSVGTHLIIGDLNGDSKNDVVVTLYELGASTGTVAAYIQGSSALSGPIYYRPGTSDSFTGALIGRFDSGSTNDLAVLDSNADIFTFLNGGATATQSSGANFAGMVAVDADGDGKTDIVTESQTGFDVHIQANLSSSTFHQVHRMDHPFVFGVGGLQQTSVNYDQLSVGDVNRDNKADILMVGIRNNTGSFMIAFGSTSVTAGSGSGSTTSSTGPEVPQGTLKALDNLFDPSQGQSTTIEFSVNKGGPTLVKIYTLQGKLIKTVYDNLVAGGSQYSAQWDGRNDNGEMVGSGIYIAHIVGPNFSKKQKIAVIR